MHWHVQRLTIDRPLAGNVSSAALGLPRHATRPTTAHASSCVSTNRHPNDACGRRVPAFSIKMDPAKGTIFVARLDRHNLLRPETAESLYFMWMLTRRKEYRRVAWRMFLSFRQHSRLPDGAYVSLADVFYNATDKDSIPVKYGGRYGRFRNGINAEMPSYWIGETLKYLFLIFQPPSRLPLDEWVFTTEAHPLRIFR